MTDIAVRNQQRRLKVNIRLLAGIAERALELVNWRATLCRGRSRQRTRRSASLQTLVSLSIVLVNDETIAELNEQFHHTRGPTDILAFEYDGLGELIISTERAVAHARRYRTTPARELALYVIHGILHLHGYDDLKPGQRQRMRAAERRLLARLGRSFDLPKLVASK
ncbi:MAG: rRNA maturation RNase YbeY [Verrucomicrobiia bacterium]|jgi:rRNA maturation RNase YbeY